MDIISKFSKNGLEKCRESLNIISIIENPDEFMGGKAVQVIEEDFSSIVGFPLPKSLNNEHLIEIGKTKEEVINAIKYYFDKKNMINLLESLKGIADV